MLKRAVMLLTIPMGSRSRWTSWLILVSMLLGLAMVLSQGTTALAQSDPCAFLSDLDRDGVVTVTDIMKVASRWRSTNPAHIALYDLDEDGDIDVVDIMLVACDWGRTHPCPFGIAMDIQVYDPDMRGAVYDAGARWTRAGVAWSSVEPSNVDLTNPANGYWPDTLFRDLEDDGLIPIVIVWIAPSWVADTSLPSKFQECGPFRDVVSPGVSGLDEFEEFVRALAERYDGDWDLDGDGDDDIPVEQDPMPNVAYFELYNEEEYDYNYGQDIPGAEDDNGGCWGHAPAKYAEALRRAFLALQEANGNAKLVFGALAYDWFTKDTRPWWIEDPPHFGPFSYDFLGDVLGYLQTSYGGDPNFPFFHMLAFHNYNDFRNNWDDWGPEVRGKIQQLRDERLAPYGLQNMPLVCTECSLASGPGDAWTNRNEELQSLYPAQSRARGMAAGLHISIWHTLVDPGGYDYGLLRSATISDKKPAYDTYTVASDRLAGVVFDKQLPTSGADGTGSSDIEAYRFTRPDGSKLIVLWTDTGERLGKVGTSPITRSMTFSSAHFGAWTGTVWVVERDGSTWTITGSTSVTISITQSPKFVYVIP
jgi:hypothetical protein